MASGTRSDRRPGAALAGWTGAAVVALTLAGCGSSSPTPQDQVRNAWEQITSATASHDAPQLCAHLTDNAVRQMIAAAGRIRPVSGCEAAAKVGFGAANGPTAPSKTGGTLSIAVHGDRASIRFAPGTATLEFVKRDGVWKLVALG